MKIADKPFEFDTQLSLVLLTGLKAGDALQLRDGLRQAPESSVYYHTHNFLQRYQFLVPEPSNDFAYWASSVLNEPLLGEKLMAIDTVRYTSMSDLKAALLSTMDAFLDKNTVLRRAPSGSEFHFMKVTLFSLPTDHVARDLAGFAECLKKVSIHSLYNHMFEGRLRTSQGVNDFSFWLDSALGETVLARQIDRLDPYLHTMEDLRQRMLRLIETRLEKENAHATTR